MYSQNGTQRIEVVIRKEGAESSQGIKGVDTDRVSTGGTSDGQSVDSEKVSRSELRKQRIIKTNTTHVLAAMKQVGNLAVNYYVGTLGYKNGDKSYQERVARQIEVVNDTTNIASSVGMGILYGSWGGPIGAVIGGLLGGVTTGTSTIFKYLGRQKEYNQTMFKENNSIQYMRSRANINLTTGRLR